MEIFIQTKSAGTKKPPLERRAYTVPEDTRTLRALITAIVCSEVERYNSKEVDPMFCNFLTQQELKSQAQTGRVSFGRIFSDRKANVDAAVATALQGFEDGLFRAVVGDAVIESPDTPLNLREGDCVTFVRLTFLAGAFW
ncbi:MAG: hypothetical protein RR295_10055 [Oscillospiraceae bacterium]